jgi:hypothetical protein
MIELSEKTNLFNEFGVIVHEPTKYVGDQISNLISDHLDVLIQQGASLEQIQAVTHWFSLNVINSCSETVLQTAMKIRKQQRAQS